MKKLLENYRTVLYSDEPLYQKLYKIFTFIDNDYDEIVHFFDRNSNEVIHIDSKKYINFSINPLTGYRNLTHIIIQKSFYKSKDLVMILRKLKTFRPEVFVLVYLDSSLEYFEKLCSIIAQEELATIAFDEDDIFAWYEMTSNNEVPVKTITSLKRSINDKINSSTNIKRCRTIFEYFQILKYLSTMRVSSDY